VAPGAISALDWSAKHGSRPLPTAPSAAGPRSPSWCGGAAVATEESGAVGCAGDRRPGGGVQRGERVAVAELVGEPIVGEQRAGVGVALGHRQARALARRHPEHDPRVARRGDAAGAIAGVGEADSRDLHRVVAGNELHDVLVEPVAAVLPTRVAEPMAHLVGGAGRRDRSGLRRPQRRRRIVVAQVQRLAVRVADRVVAPGRQAVLAAVAGSRCSRRRSRSRKPVCSLATTLIQVTAPRRIRATGSRTRRPLA
jgi:hypothetical protein